MIKLSCSQLSIELRRHVGNEGIAPRIPNLGSRWILMVASLLSLFISRQLSPGAHLVEGYVTTWAHLDIRTRQFIMLLLEHSPNSSVVQPVVQSLHQQTTHGTEEKCVQIF
jgi:hypothetical protein